MSTAELHWFKSSYSDSSEPGDCVEVATTPVTIHIRDSKNPAYGILTVSPGAWAEFVVRMGDRPQVG
ncbi:DUF397 domain-containing protein [Streptomyces sp. ME18-1-4]|uniref:DUF397 domain-containing protein n=1 Tax=Streptomyces sp. ME18-1-4 TaxID=3028685 RepID=UPI0029AB6CA5|nr:DUF397 domain-containing protein [Streptomyces sp. ME18-1-4]MDX3241754.1 DUF397 domain-containing protein [Streptomyces sp. ME18-1-4]